MKKIFTICLALVAMSMSAARVTSVWSGTHSFSSAYGTPAFTNIDAANFSNLELGDYLQVTVSGINNPDGWGQIGLYGNDGWKALVNCVIVNVVGANTYQINDAEVLASIKSGGLAVQGSYITLTDISIVYHNDRTLWSGEKAIDWNESVNLDKSKFATAQAGDKVFCYFKDATESAQARVQYATADWSSWPDLMPTKNIAGNMYEMQLTEEMLEAIATSATIAFNGKEHTLTKIVLHYTTTLDLDETDGSKNLNLLDAHDDEMCDVTINRSFTADGGWYTLCLPFDLSVDQVDATLNGTLKELEYSELNENVLSINFKDADAVEAGKPYLFKPTEDLNSLSFENVTIDATTPEPVQTTYVTMYSTYDRPQLTSEDFIIAEVSGESTLVRAENGTWIRAFRGYFTLDPTAANAAIRVVTTPGFVTGVEEAAALKCRKQIRNGQIVIVKDNKMFNLQGVRLQ